MEKLTLDSIQLEKRFCSACDSFQWHIERKDSGWECLGCRVRELGSNPTSILPEPYQREVRIYLREIPTWKLREAYDKLKAGEATSIELVEQNRAQAISAIAEILWERGKLKEEEKIMPKTEQGDEVINKFLPMSPEEGPPLPRVLKIKWPWKD